jgi:hypothetical protein
MLDWQCPIAAVENRIFPRSSARILTGGTMVSADLGTKLENVTINMLGRALVGEAKRGSSATGFTGWPHSGQNLAVDETAPPQLPQARPSGVAHCSQNFAPAEFSCSQFGARQGSRP